VVTAADIVGKRLTAFVYVQGEAAFAAAGRAGVPGLHTCVWLQSICVSVHCFVMFVQCPSVHHVWCPAGQWTEMLSCA